MCSPSFFRGIVVLLALILATLPLVPLRAQMPPPRYTPNVDLTNAAYPLALARLPNGKIVVGGGDLRRVDGVDQSYLARLNSDGSLDSSWNPAPDGTVGALWVDAAGMLYAGGFFSHIAGQPRAGLARFNVSGVLDANWAPMADGGVNAIAAGLSGTVCFGGTFTHINTIAHNRLACVSTVDGSLLAGFTPDVNGTVSRLLTDGNNLYVSGYFSMIGATPRTYAARLALSGDGTPDSWNPAANNVVLTFLPTGSGAVYIGGFFGGVGATVRPGIAKVNDTTGAAVTAFNAQAAGAGGGYVLDICSDGAGGVVAVGAFSSIGGQTRRNVARLDGTTGNAIAGFDPGIDYGYALHVLANPDGTYLIAGPYSSLGGGEHLALGRLLADGSVDANFNPSLESPGFGFVIERLPTPGAFVVGGRFVHANGLIRRNLFKLSLPGVVDPNWIANTDDDVRALAVDAVGRIYVSGYFTHVGGFARPYIARLQNTTDGAVDSTWSSIASSYGVYPLLLRPEGLYAIGYFSSSNIVRLSTVAGSTDAGWAPQLSGSAYGMAATATGDLLLVGNFTSVNGTPRSGAAKLGTGVSAALDTSWAPALTGGTGAVLAVDGDDVYIGGTFTGVGATPRAGLARVSASGTGALDMAWAPSVDNQVAKLLPQPEGIYVAGYFGNVDANGHSYLARVDRTTGAIDPTWTSAANNWVLDLLPYRGSIFTIGWFSSIAGQLRQAVARLPVAGDTIFVDDLDG